MDHPTRKEIAFELCRIFMEVTQTTAGNLRHRKCDQFYIFSRQGGRNEYWHAFLHLSVSNFVALERLNENNFKVDPKHQVP